MEPLRILDEIEQTTFGGHLAKDQPLWQSLRTALERQAEELAQKEARIARLEQAIRDELADMQQALSPPDRIAIAIEEALNESEPQSAAHLKAEVLHELADLCNGVTVSVDAIREQANKLEREAKEEL